MDTFIIQVSMAHFVALGEKVIYTYGILIVLSLRWS